MGGSTIRRARPADHAPLQPLWTELDDFHHGGDPDLLRPATPNPRPQSYLDELLADPRAAVFVAQGDAGLAGVAVIRLQDAPPLPMFREKTWAVIDAIGVHANARRRGIGRALFDACQRWSQEQQAAWLELTVYEFNDSARRFYESLGFETVRRRMRLG